MVCQISKKQIMSNDSLVFCRELQQHSTMFSTCSATSLLGNTQEMKNLTISSEPCSLTICLNPYILNSEKFAWYMVRDELNENTQRVLQFIQRHPGCHLRWILKDLGLSMGTTQYHLEILEKMGKIISEKDSFQRFYFPVGSFGTVEKNLLKILNQETARDILLYIIEKKEPTQTDIVNSIKISPATANWHISKLIELEIIREERDGKFKKYSFNGNPGTVVNILKNYHASIWNTWSSRMAELFITASSEEKKK